VSDSVWKKEISFRRKREPAPAPEAAAVEPPLHGETSLARQLAFQRRLEAAAAAVAAPTEPAPSPVVARPLPHVVEMPVEGEQSIWRKEISFKRKPRAEEPEQPAEPPTSIWKKEITFRRKPEAPRGDSIWTKDISLRRREARQAQIKQLAEQALQAIDADVEAEPWLSTPQLPPEPDPEPAAAPVSVPAPAAAESARTPDAAPEKPAATSMWKRELSFSKSKSKEPKSKEPKATKRGRKQPAAAGDATAPERGGKRSLSLPKLPKPATRSHATSGHAVKRLVGLKIGASQLAAARVSNNGAAELLQVARQPLEQGVVVGGEVRDPEALATALKQFFAKNKLPKKNVRLGIASNRIGVRIFDLVGIDDEKQMENAIRFRAQEALPIPIDEAVLDYHVLGESVDEDGTKLQRILLVVAYRELVDRYVSACRRAGISVAGVDLEAFALLRALGAPRADDASADAAVVAVAIGHDRSTFAVSDGRTCEFTRVIEWGGATLNVAIARALDLAPSEVELVKRLVSLDSEAIPEGIEQDQYMLAVDAVRKQVQAFARELVSSLQFYQHQPGSLGIGEIVITGGTTALVGLAGELERLIGVRVRVGDPLARMKVPKKLAVGDHIGSLAIAIGLGIED
jgi:type IV pilus assembly protein PilM